MNKIIIPILILVCVTLLLTYVLVIPPDRKAEFNITEKSIVDCQKIPIFPERSSNIMLSGNRVVWQDLRDGECRTSHVVGVTETFCSPWKIYSYDLDTKSEKEVVDIDSLNLGSDIILEDILILDFKDNKLLYYIEYSKEYMEGFFTYNSSIYLYDFDTDKSTILKECNNQDTGNIDDKIDRLYCYHDDYPRENEYIAFYTKSGELIERVYMNVGKGMYFSSVRNNKILLEFYESLTNSAIFLYDLQTKNLSKISENGTVTSHAAFLTDDIVIWNMRLIEPDKLLGRGDEPMLAIYSIKNQKPVYIDRYFPFPEAFNVGSSIAFGPPIKYVPSSRLLHTDKLIWVNSEEGVLSEINLFDSTIINYNIDLNVKSIPFTAGDKIILRLEDYGGIHLCTLPD